MQTPKAGDRFTVNKLEHPLLPVAPLDELGAAVLVLEKFEKELPEVGRRSFSRLPFARHPVRTNFWRPHFLLGSFQGILVGGEGCRVVKHVFSRW